MREVPPDMPPGWFDQIEATGDLRPDMQVPSANDQQANVPAYRSLSEQILTNLRPVGPRLSTGFATLDQATRGGIPIGRVVVVAGAPGAGKSTLATYWLDQWEQAGSATVYLAADEHAEGIVMRLGQLAGFSREVLEDDSDAGATVRLGFAQRVEGRSLVVLDPDADPSMRTIEDAERVLLHLAGERTRVLIVDSLQTVACAAADLAESAREKIDAKIAIAKAIARRGTLVVLISEMSRAGYRSGDRSQDISALAAAKESGSVEYGAALLLGLRSVKGEHGRIDVEVAKNRLGGAKPEFRLELDPERASLAEIERSDDDGGAVAKRAHFAALRSSILDAIRSQRLASANKVFQAVKGNRKEVLDEVRDMVAEGAIVTVDGAFRIATEARRPS